ncbi:MAG TPA: Wzz/FepE/Etk N-terminal domain-containing protein [Acidobacteriota bacterium]|nr:Wzz/FepE/Etk N-terminal domain-containing protein [Acidobacteriota bacterium]
MKKAKLQNLSDYMALLIRMKWWVIITTVVLAGIAILVALQFPKVYVSKTVLQLQPREVPSDFVLDMISTSTPERMRAIEQTILSRTNLLRILREHEDRLPEYRGLNDDGKAARLRGGISINFTTGQQRGGSLIGIEISYRNKNPELAQRITARLASIFIEQDNITRESQVFGTREFMESELNKVAAELQQTQDQLAWFKQRNRHELPSELNTNLRTLDRLQLQQNSNLEALDRYVTLRMNLEMQMASTPSMLPRESVGAVARDPQLDAYKAAKQAYDLLILRVQPNHPDARRLKAELDRLGKDITSEDLAMIMDEIEAEADASSRPVETAPAPNMVPNPVYQNLEAQMRQLNTDIEIRERERVWIEEEMARYNRRITNTPVVEQEMTALLRKNNELTKTHDDLRSKVDQAALAGSLESRQRGEQINIIDPANFPMQPSSANPVVILLAGFVFSLGAGVAVAVGVGIIKPQVWTMKELERMMEIPVLVEIPAIVSPRESRITLLGRLARVTVFVIAAGVYLGGIYYVYLQQFSVLRYLDPFIGIIAERTVR